MDEDLANVIRNDIPNDYCKLLCMRLIDTNDENNRLIELYTKDILTYCAVYERTYFIRVLYGEKKIGNIKDNSGIFKYVYYYDLMKNNESDINVEEEIEWIYSKEKNMKELLKEIETLSVTNLSRRIIKHYWKKNKKSNRDIVTKNLKILSQRLEIILDCIRYKVLIKILDLKDNEKIDKLLNWNISRVKKYNTIDYDLWSI